MLRRRSSYFSALSPFFCLMPFALAGVLVWPLHALASDGGGGSFCLFELPPDGSGVQRYLNLTIVQYIEVSDDGVKIVYGGGALGSGYDVKIPATSRDEAQAFVDRMQKAAGLCR